MGTLKWPAAGSSAFSCPLMEFSALFLQGSRASLCAGGCEGGSVRTMPQACRGALGPVVASHEAAVARGDKELAHVIGVRLWEEVQAPHVAQAQSHLRPEAPAEHLDGRGPLGVRGLPGTFLWACGPCTPGRAGYRAGITGTGGPGSPGRLGGSAPAQARTDAQAACRARHLMCSWYGIWSLVSGISGLLGQVQVDDVGGVLWLVPGGPPESSRASHPGTWGFAVSVLNPGGGPAGWALFWAPMCSWRRRGPPRWSSTPGNSSSEVVCFPHWSGEWGRPLCHWAALRSRTPGTHGWGTRTWRALTWELRLHLYRDSFSSQSF